MGSRKINFAGLGVWGGYYIGYGFFWVQRLEDNEHGAVPGGSVRWGVQEYEGGKPPSLVRLVCIESASSEEKKRFKT